MNIGTLKVLCDSIERTSPTRLGNDTFLTLLLDDVDASCLMQQLVAKLDATDLLDYFKDSVIEEYLAGRKSTKLSPREQYEALANE
mgnify:CR=1 FL=1